MLEYAINYYRKNRDSSQNIEISNKPQKNLPSLNANDKAARAGETGSAYCGFLILYMLRYITLEESCHTIILMVVVI